MVLKANSGQSGLDGTAGNTADLRRGAGHQQAERVSETVKKRADLKPLMRLIPYILPHRLMLIA